METKKTSRGLAVVGKPSIENVLEALGRVSKACNTRAAVQVLTGVHLSVDSGKLVTWATDMEVAFREEVEVSKGTGDPCVVPNVANLIAALKTLDGDVRFKVKAKEGKLEVLDSEGTSILFDLGLVEDFPRHPLDGEKVNEGFVVHRNAFMRMFDRIVVCASKDESRPVLTSIQFERAENRLVACGTDSYRLAVDQCATGPGEFVDMLVPAKALTRALRFVGGETLRFSQRIEGESALWLVITNGSRQACIRRVEGQFPNWRQLIPEAYEATAVVNRASLAKAVARIDKLGRQNAPARLQPVAADKMLLSYEGHDQPSVRSQLDVELAGTWESAIGTNAGFFRDGLEGFDTERVQLNFINPLRPLLITDEGWTPHQSLWPERLYLLMPIRLPDHYVA